ncbi:MAG: hypothetical protein BRD48_07595 [Bacteroidetes bacterium QS_9_68_14]|nr:MAG: hypothetical protein BRD48_07595 [Bacteroidetes bacterium QS_9_68_14]
MSRPCLAFSFSLVLLLAGAWLAPAQDTSDAEAARPDVKLAIGGTLQPRVSHGRLDLANPGTDRERTGFGIRRARLRASATLAGRAGASFQLGAAGASVMLLDAKLFFDVTDALRVRAGRFTVAQPRAFQPTSHTEIDLGARAAIARRWGNSTLGNSGRDFGVGAVYETDRLTGRVALHNGNGSWDRALGNVRPDVVGDPTGGGDTRGGAASAYGAWRPAALPGLEVGGYAGYNAARNAATVAPEALRPGGGRFDSTARSYASYAGHLYWGAWPGSQPVRLKADLIGTRYETRSASAGEISQHALGASLLGAVGLFDRSAELLARIERYDAAIGRDGNATDYLSAGASLSLSALRGRPYERQRLSVGYATRLDDNRRPHLVVLQAQIVF